MISQLEPHATAGPAVRPSRVLRSKIAGLRRKLLEVTLLTGLATIVIIGVELLGLMLFLDWWLELPWTARLVSLVGQGAVLGWLVFRLMVRPLVRQPGDDALALEVEKARPELRSRLIASIQLSRPGAVPAGASEELAAATVQEAEAMAGRMDFGAVVPTQRLKKLGTLAAGLGLLALAIVFTGHAITFDLLKRAWLAQVPVPRKTRVLVLEPDKILGRGDSVRLEAVAQGIIPAAGKLVVKYPNRLTRQYPLEPERGRRGRFVRALENIQESFAYQVRLNDGVSPWHDVKVIARPTVAAIACEQEYPAYTGLKPARRAAGDLALLAGSRLRLRITATKSIEGGWLKCSGLNLSVPLEVSGPDRRQLTGELRIPRQGLNGFSVQMRDTEGMESRDAAVYRIDVIPDQAPAARLTHPARKEELITRQATLVLGLEITDDFAIDKARLCYTVDTVAGGAQKSIDLDLGGEHPRQLRRRHEWKLGAFDPPLQEGSRIEYWLEAADNNDVTGPGVGGSEHQFARVVSEAEKRADLLNRAGDYLGSIGEVAEDQEKLNRNLGAIIREKVLPPQIGVPPK